MSGLFGVPDKWATSIDGSDELNMAHTAAQIQQLGASTRLTSAQAGKAEMELSEEQTAARLMQDRARGGTSSDAANDPIAEMERLGGQLFEAGAITKGEKLLNQASQIRQRQAAAAANQSRQKLAQLKEQEALTQDLYETLASAKDAPSWDIAKMQWVMKHPQEKIPPQLQDYDPEVLGQLRESTKHGLALIRQQSTEAHQVEQEEHAKREEEIQRQAERGRNARADARAKERQQRFDARLKAGAPPRNASSTEIAQAQKLIQDDYPDLVPDLDLGTAKNPKPTLSAAADMAEEARAMIQQNRALSYPEALNRVYIAAKVNGDFQKEVVPEKKFMGYTTQKEGTKTTYKRGGPGSTASPLPLPPKGQKLVDGKVYSKPDGTLFKWDAAKGGGVVVKKPVSASRVPVEDDGEENDDE